MISSRIDNTQQRREKDRLANSLLSVDPAARPCSPASNRSPMRRESLTALSPREPDTSMASTSVFGPSNRPSSQFPPFAGAYGWGGPLIMPFALKVSSECTFKSLGGLLSFSQFGHRPVVRLWSPCHRRSSLTALFNIVPLHHSCCLRYDYLGPLDHHLVWVDCQPRHLRS